MNAICDQTRSFPMAADHGRSHTVGLLILVSGLIPHWYSFPAPEVYMFPHSPTAPFPPISENTILL
jgi:hypothetical protein